MQEISTGDLLRRSSSDEASWRSHCGLPELAIDPFVRQGIRDVQ